MKEQTYPPSPFELADKAFADALPIPVRTIDDDLVKVRLPGSRYDEIEEAVVRMYEKANADIIPLPVFDISNGLGYSLIPYRAFGPRIHDVLIKASMDAVTMRFNGSSRPAILYNDRIISTRVNFSIMHEIAHNELGHKEPSQLAEIEANHFAAEALCPMALLEHYHISETQKIIKIFNISEDCASNRAKTMRNRTLRSLSISPRCRRLRDNIIARFKFAARFQRDLFGELVF